MSDMGKQMYVTFLENTPVILFVVIFLGFAVFSPHFFTYGNIKNILEQSSYIGIVAIGVTLTLLIGGIDISVGSNMYVAAVTAGILINWNQPLWVGLVACLLVGIGFGIVNAFAIVELKVNPLIVTLGTLVAGRGLGLYITDAVTVLYPMGLLDIASIDLLGVLPVPLFVLVVVVLLVVYLLRSTMIGRQMYALGHDEESAEVAGINKRYISWVVYILCGLFAALGGFINVAQIGSVNAAFGEGIEFRAIAAAVLGGTSLYGGRGTVFPGTVLGTILLETIGIGMVFVQMELYLQPIVTGVILFLAVWIDSFRTRELRRLQTRTIRSEELAEAA